MASRYSFHELCRELGKPPQLIRNIQTGLGLHLPDKAMGYSDAYANFLRQVICLRTFSVPMEDVHDLLRKELKILTLLNADSITDSPTWYLDSCPPEPQNGPGRLLLTGYDLGFPIESGAIQSNLDFRGRQPELFASHEMGEDIRNVVGLYLKALDRVRQRVRLEKPLIERALYWSEQVFWSAGA